MNIQADIQWIKSELDKINDPDFVKALKSLFNYRIKQTGIVPKQHIAFNC